MKVQKIENTIKIKEYTFLVLIDFSECSYKALKYAISLAKETGGKIHLFHVGEINKITQSENALVIRKRIAEGSIIIREKLKSIVEIIQQENIAVSSAFSYGNEQDEIENQIELINPDITVIGRRKKRLNYRGKITNYLLNQYAGCVLIGGNKETFHAKTKISIACNNSTISKSNITIVNGLHSFVDSTLSIINIVKESNTPVLTNYSTLFTGNKERLSYAFIVNINIAEGLAEHIEKKQINLFCIGRSKDTNWILNRFFGRGSTATTIVDKVEVPIVILSNAN